ncbi:MAG: hypothetical protein WAS26_15625 [Paracoccaceae bacterium]
MSSPAAALGLAYSPWVASDAVTEADRLLLHALLDPCGASDEVADEGHLDIFTAMTGPVPGFVAYFAASMIDYATAQGILPQNRRSSDPTVVCRRGGDDVRLRRRAARSRSRDGRVRWHDCRRSAGNDYRGPWAGHCCWARGVGSQMPGSGRGVAAVQTGTGWQIAKWHVAAGLGITNAGEKQGRLSGGVVRSCVSSVDIH